jgi:hypothetical protein
VSDIEERSVLPPGEKRVTLPRSTSRESSSTFLELFAYTHVWEYSPLWLARLHVPASAHVGIQGSTRRCMQAGGIAMPVGNVPGRSTFALEPSLYFGGA